MDIFFHFMISCYGKLYFLIHIILFWMDKCFLSLREVEIDIFYNLMISFNGRLYLAFSCQSKHQVRMPTHIISCFNVRRNIRRKREGF